MWLCDVRQCQLFTNMQSSISAELNAQLLIHVCVVDIIVLIVSLIQEKLLQKQVKIKMHNLI